MIKRAVKAAMNAVANNSGRYLQQRMAAVAMERSVTVRHNGHDLHWPVPSRLCRYRAETFSTKEPETLEWIDTMFRGSVLWDVGANIGLYSVYAAKASGCRVFAFEPSVFNLECLARSIALNDVSDEVTIVPIPLTDRLGLEYLRLRSADYGDALNSFGTDEGFDGGQIDEGFRYSMPGIIMDDARWYGISAPDYIKIDVDGIEARVLAGGSAMLRKVRSVQIEINDDHPTQAEECAALLIAAGLTFKSKRHGAMFDRSAKHGGNYNQLWVRD